jgi:hypothetical protein
VSFFAFIIKFEKNINNHRINIINKPILLNNNQVNESFASYLNFDKTRFSNISDNVQFLYYFVFFLKFSF